MLLSCWNARQVLVVRASRRSRTQGLPQVVNVLLILFRGSVESFRFRKWRFLSEAPSLPELLSRQLL